MIQSSPLEGQPFSPLELMNTFFAILRTSFRRQLAYRAANLSGLATNLMFGIFRAWVLIALYQDRTSVNSLTIQGAITYAGLAQSVIGFLSFFHWYELMNTVYDGQVGSDLIKPLSFFSYWLGIDGGRALGSLLIRSIPLFVVYSLFNNVILPQTFLQWIAFISALLFSWLISFGWRFLVNLAAFWTPNAIGVGRFAFGLSWIFSGFFMPLALLPDWLANFSRLTPFGASVYIPIQIFIGNIQGGNLAKGLLIQVIWILILFTLDHFMMKLGIKRLVIQGG